jgi:hypothetical protein
METYQPHGQYFAKFSKGCQGFILPAAHYYRSAGNEARRPGKSSRELGLILFWGLSG